MEELQEQTGSFFSPSDKTGVRRLASSVCQNAASSSQLPLTLFQKRGTQGYFMFLHVIFLIYLLLSLELNFESTLLSSGHSSRLFFPCFQPFSPTSVESGVSAFLCILTASKRVHCWLFFVEWGRTQATNKKGLNEVDNNIWKSGNLAHSCILHWQQYIIGSW